MDQLRVVDDLIAEYDLSQETGRKRAYRKCEEYATEHIAGRVEYNAFMGAVSEKLGMPATRRDSFVEELGEVPENAKLYLRYSRAGPELTGNAEGLRYLAALVTELADQSIEDDHAHLYAGRPPMYGNTYPLIIYHEPDAWFERLEAGQEEPSIAVRNIEPSEVVALCLLGSIPPGMLLTKQRLYRVLAVRAYDGHEIWEKRIREENERFFIFTIINDDGVQESFGFDLDDSEVLLFSRQDIAGVCDA